MSGQVDLPFPSTLENQLFTRCVWSSRNLKVRVEASDVTLLDESVSEPAVEAEFGSLNDAAWKFIPQEICQSIPCLGLRWDGPRLVVAIPEGVEPALKALLGSSELEYTCISAPESDIREALELVLAQEAADQDQPLTGTATVGNDASIAELIDHLIERAVAERASDLHLEPFPSGVRVRIRVDGRLRTIKELPWGAGPALISRIKILAQMNIVERRRPQDGQFSQTVKGRSIDLRVATSATLHGEKAVLRIHDGRRPLVTLEELGMNRSQLAVFTRLISADNGLVLAAGPTGSGKTTTLHSALRAVDVPHKNVSTIEDPVEYVVPGINQIPVSDAHGAGFAVQLRALLRQDPDVILVGETRDAETARISVQASLTGHLVLSSIHATDAVGAVYRLLQMGIEPHLVASSLRGVVSQRLVRRVCRYCAVERDVNNVTIEMLEAAGVDELNFLTGVGCAMCAGTGYRDRVACYQLLVVSEHLSELIASHPEPAAFRRAARAEGLRSISDEALRLAGAGITTLEEAMHLVDSDE